MPAFSPRPVTKRASHALLGLGRKRLGRGLGHCLGMLMRRAAEKTNLLSIAPTPAAQQQVNAQANYLQRGQSAIHTVRLKPACLAAIG